MYRRPYDQLMASIAYPRRKVRLMGFLPGVTTPGGMTHQAIEDIAVMRSIPNMTILETGDATEVESICDAADSIDGPVWCRVLRGSVPRLFDTPIRVGEMRVLSEGDDILSSPRASAPRKRCAPARRWRGRGCRSGICTCTRSSRSITPLLDHIGSVKHGVVTLENHVTEGGIGSLVAETMADAGVGKRLVRLGLKDTYAHGGSRPYLMRYYGLDALALVGGIEDLIGQQFGIVRG